MPTEDPAPRRLTLHGLNPGKKSVSQDKFINRTTASNLNMNNKTKDNNDFDRSALESLVNEAWDGDAELLNNQHFRFLELLDELMPVDYPKR